MVDRLKRTGHWIAGRRLQELDHRRDPQGLSGYRAEPLTGSRSSSAIRNYPAPQAEELWPHAGRPVQSEASCLIFPDSLLVNAICLVIDRLHRGFLGAYGNTWIETPAFDRLAAESFVFDQMLVDSPRLGPLYRSFWQGWHALAPAGRRIGPRCRPCSAKRA